MYASRSRDQEGGHSPCMQNSEFDPVDISMSSSEDGATPTYSLWGWERFFGEVLQFLETCKRQSGIANQQLAEHVVERLEICIGNISGLRDTIGEAMVNYKQERDDISNVKLVHVMICG